MTNETEETRSLPTVPERDPLNSGGHALRALDSVRVAQVFEGWRDDATRKAAGTIPLGSSRPPASAETKFIERVSRAQVFGDLAEKFRALGEDHRRAVVVRSEPRVYGPGSGNSFYLDVARSALPGTAYHGDAVARLARHSQEVSTEAKAGSAEGRRALRVAETRGREISDGAVLDERRAMTTGSTSGGALVTPEYLVSNYALFRAFPASFYEQSVKLPDPGFGMTAYVPAFTSAPTVAQQFEGGTVSNSSPGAGYLSANLVTVAGEIDVSQQLFDRAGPIDFDEIAHAALADSLAQQLDQYALTTALATAGTVAGAASFTAAKLWGDIATAKAQMLTTAGTKLPASHLFVTPELGEWLLSQVDPNDRPLLLPTPANTVLPIAPGPNGGPPLGYTGNRLLSTAVFEDGSIPVTSPAYDTQIVVANMAEVFTLTSEPSLRVIPETLAPDLLVTIQLYALLGVVVRHTAAIQTITGAAYPVAPSFAT